MLLALWAGFAGPWGSVSLSISLPPLVIPDASLATGGRGRPDNSYQMLSDEYWDIREASITGHTPKEEPATSVDPLPKLDTPSRRSMLDAIKQASSIEDMKAASAKLHKYDGTA